MFTKEELKEKLKRTNWSKVFFGLSILFTAMDVYIEASVVQFFLDGFMMAYFGTKSKFF